MKTSDLKKAYKKEGHLVDGFMIYTDLRCKIIRSNEDIKAMKNLDEVIIADVKKSLNEGIDVLKKQIANIEKNGIKSDLPFLIVGYKAEKKSSQYQDAKEEIVEEDK